MAYIALSPHCKWRLSLRQCTLALSGYATVDVVALLHTYTLGMRKSINTYVRPSLSVYHGRGKKEKVHDTIDDLGMSQREFTTKGIGEILHT